MKSTLQKALNLYPSEIKKTFFFAVCGFCWSYALTLSVTLFDSLFLEHVGAIHLPKAYATSSSLVIVLSFIILRLMKTKSLAKIFSYVLVCEVILVTFFITQSFLFAKTPIWVAFMYRIISTMGLSIVTSSFWSLMDQYFDLQDAKRIYALVFSSLFLGAILSNFTISFGFIFIGYQGLALFIASGYLLSFLLAKIITAKFLLAHDDQSETNAVGIPVKELFKKILSSKFTLLLVVYSMLGEFIWNTTEFGYLNEFQNYFQSLDPTHFETDPRLIRYLATSKGIISLFDVVVSLFVYSRMVSKIGVNGIIFVPFVLFFILYSFWIGFPSLVVGTLALFLVEGVLYLVGDNNFSLLLHAIPNKIRIPFRVISTAFLDPLSMLFTAIFLSLPFIHFVYLGFTLVCCILIVTYILNRNYQKAIYENLKEAYLSFTKPLSFYFQSQSKKSRQRQIKRCFQEIGKPLSAFELLLAVSNEKIAMEYLKKLNKKEQLHILSQPKFEAFLKEAVEILEAIDDPTAAFLLAKTKALTKKQALLFLQSEHLELRKASIIALLLTHDHDKALLVFNTLFDSDVVQEKRASLEILHEINTLKTAKELLVFLDDKELQLDAIKAMSNRKEMDRSTALKIIEGLKVHTNTHYRIEAINALHLHLSPSILKALMKVSIIFRPSEKRAIEKLILKVGHPLTSPLLELVKGDEDLQVKLLAGRCLGDLSYQLLVDHLEEIIYPQIQNAYILFYLTHNKEKKWNEQKFLKEAFSQGYNRSLDFIIQMLGYSYSLEDPELISYALYSKNEKVQAHAIETLEKSNLFIFKKIEFLIDDSPLLEKLELCIKYEPSLEMIEIEDIIDKMEHSNQLMDQMALLLYFEKTNQLSAKKRLIASMDHPLIEPFAKEII